MNLHREHHFEREICEHLGRNGWLYTEGDAAHYDRASALFLPDLLAWIEANGYRMIGPMREVYLRYGADGLDFELPATHLARDKDEYVTELQVSVSSEKE